MEFVNVNDNVTSAESITVLTKENRELKKSSQRDNYYGKDLRDKFQYGPKVAVAVALVRLERKGERNEIQRGWHSMGNSHTYY